MKCQTCIHAKKDKERDIVIDCDRKIQFPMISNIDCPFYEQTEYANEMGQ